MRATLAFIAFAALSRAPQEAQAPAAATASIEGVVLEAGSNSPVSGAEVWFTRLGGAARPFNAATGPSVTSNDDGKFAISGLEAGRYRLGVRRSGYTSQEYGPVTNIVSCPQCQRGIEVLAGQTMRNVTFTLMRTGGIEGRTIQSGGRPAVGVDVLLLKTVYDPNGQQALERVLHTQADDRGNYRLYHVTPGEYYLAAGSNFVLPNGLTLASSNSSNGLLVPDRFPLTFYPAAPDQASAMKIRVPAGGTLNGIDFVLGRQETYNLRGRIVDDRGNPSPKSVSFALRTSGSLRDSSVGQLGLDPSAFSRSYNETNGTFQLGGLPRGTYSVRAQWDGGAEAFATATITNADIENVVLASEAGITISGKIRLDGGDYATFPEFSRIQIPVRLVPTGDSTSMFATPLTTVVARDGSFTLRNVIPGVQYKVTAGAGPNVYFKEAWFGSKDVLNNPLVASRENSQDLQVTLSPNVSEVSGTVRNVQSEPMKNIPVVVVPDQRYRTGVFRSTMTDAEGKFSVPALPPGNYKVFAWTAIEEYAWFNPDLLRRFENSATPVNVTDSSRPNVEVRSLGPAFPVP